MVGMEGRGQTYGGDGGEGSNLWWGWRGGVKPVVGVKGRGQTCDGGGGGGFKPVVGVKGRGQTCDGGGGWKGQICDQPSNFCSVSSHGISFVKMPSPR